MAFGKEEVCAYLDESRGCLRSSRSRGGLHHGGDGRALIALRQCGGEEPPSARRQEAQLLSGRHARGQAGESEGFAGGSRSAALAFCLGRGLAGNARSARRGGVALRRAERRRKGKCRWCSTRLCAIGRPWACIPTTTRPRCAFLCPTCWRCSKIAPCPIGSWIWMRHKALLFRHLAEVRMMRGRELGRLRGLLALSMELRRWSRSYADNGARTMLCFSSDKTHPQRRNYP